MASEGRECLELLLAGGVRETKAELHPLSSGVVLGRTEIQHGGSVHAQRPRGRKEPVRRVRVGRNLVLFAQGRDILGLGLTALPAIGGL